VSVVRRPGRHRCPPPSRSVSCAAFHPHCRRSRSGGLPIDRKRRRPSVHHGEGGKVVCSRRSHPPGRDVGSPSPRPRDPPDVDIAEVSSGTRAFDHRREIYVQPYPGPGGKWQISIDGGQEPVWNPRGDELFYRSGNKMMALDIDTRSAFSADKPRMLFEGPYLPTAASFLLRCQPRRPALPHAEAGRVASPRPHANPHRAELVRRVETKSPCEVVYFRSVEDTRRGTWPTPREVP